MLRRGLNEGLVWRMRLEAHGGFARKLDGKPPGEEKQPDVRVERGSLRKIQEVWKNSTQFIPRGARATGLDKQLRQPYPSSFVLRTRTKDRQTGCKKLDG